MEEKPDELATVDAVRALVQAFEDGAGEGVEEGKEGAKRKGGVHFLASVFANISMVSPILCGQDLQIADIPTIGPSNSTNATESISSIPKAG